MSPLLVRWLLPVVALWTRVMFRPTLTGLAHLPTDRPFLLVANHSGGLALAELSSFAVLYLRATNKQRPLAGFAHTVGFGLWPLRPVLHALGAIPSTYQAATDALQAGIPLLVFPGGDHEGFRPVWQANRVDFGGREGFLKIARGANVPIVPMGIRGSHWTVPILWRSTRILPYALVLPRVLGIKRFPLTLLGAVGAIGLVTQCPGLGVWRWPLAWAWLSSVPMFFPWVPWTIRFRVGPPMLPESLFASGDLSAARARVEAEVQALVDAAS